ncbi:hypothetical protein [Haloarchaeobius salinus]|uniref:hypothetical protein n=1 Tax=Haloarchaeobius salinus TaxID=1198298 RepID=UPI00210D9FFE|nr:hypothetical protein [Haloarchaeobius salinus]
MGFIERLSGLLDRGGTETSDGTATGDAGPTGNTDVPAGGPQESQATTGEAVPDEATDEGTTDNEPDPTAAFAEQAAALAAEHPELDGSIDSLAAADDLAASHDPDGETVLALGSYFGEALLSAHDGEWTKPKGGIWAVVLDGAETDVTLNAFQLAGEVVRGPTTFTATYSVVERRL